MLGVAGPGRRLPGAVLCPSVCPEMAVLRPWRSLRWLLCGAVTGQGPAQLRGEACAGRSGPVREPLEHFGGAGVRIPSPPCPPACLCRPHLGRRGCWSPKGIAQQAQAPLCRCGPSAPRSAAGGCLCPGSDRFCRYLPLTAALLRLATPRPDPEGVLLCDWAQPGDCSEGWICPDAATSLGPLFKGEW